MPYRNEKEALSARAAELAKSLEALRSSRETLADEQRKVEDETAKVAQRIADLEAEPATGLLDRVRVASPCSAKWDDMVGDERERFCLSCDKQVFNISAMARAEAEAFLAARVGSKTCVRFFRRADGTILTDDCPTGVRRKRLRVLGAVALGGGAMLAGAAALLGAQPSAKVTVTASTPNPRASSSAPMPGWTEQAGSQGSGACMGDCAFDPTPTVQEHRIPNPPPEEGK